jgi:thioredoxin-related protein
MRNLFFILALGGILFLYGSAVNAQTVYTFDNGLAAAKSQNKKIIVNIYSESDKWSQKMDEVYQNPDVQSLMDSFIYVKLNPAGSETYSYEGKKYNAADLAKVLGLTSYPTHAFLTSDGKVIKFKYNGVESSSFPGYVDAGDFVSILTYFRDGKYSDTDLSTVL